LLPWLLFQVLKSSPDKDISSTIFLTKFQVSLKIIGDSNSCQHCCDHVESQQF